jgi:pimeloyl-ACP methyl ester carboxylesterase
MAGSTDFPTVEGPGSVSEAPNLPEGFTDTFASRYVDAGALRLHAVIGGDGPPLLLVHGWPETWYAWRLMMPALAENFEVIAVDQRGMGLSDKPRDGYDTASVANDLVALMDALGHRRFAMVGCDTGMLIGYALAADHPDRVDRLALGEAPLPGVSPTPPLFLPGPLNERLWHIPFNALPEVNEKLVSGREDIFFGEKFSNAGRKEEAVHRRRQVLRRPPRGRPGGAAGQLRALPRLPGEPGAERAAQDPAADDARPGDRRS